MAKYLKVGTNGFTEEQAGLTASAGAGDANKIVETTSTGRLDPSLMPAGVGVQTITVTASEALAAGDFVNLHDSTGLKARKASAAAIGTRAHGFVLAAVSSGAAATVYMSGANTSVTGQTVAATVFLSATTPGATTTTAPSTAGQIVQPLGVVSSATEIQVDIEDSPIIRA